jgi:hypothetical protein
MSRMSREYILLRQDSWLKNTIYIRTLRRDTRKKTRKGEKFILLHIYTIYQDIEYIYIDYISIYIYVYIYRHKFRISSFDHGRGHTKFKFKIEHVCDQDIHKYNIHNIIILSYILYNIYIYFSQSVCVDVCYTCVHTYS